MKVLDQAATAKAIAAYVAAARVNEGPRQVVETVLQAYLQYAPVRHEDPSRLSPLSKALMAMAPGAVTTYPASAATVTRYAYTARKALGNPQARWSVKSLSEGVTRITRLEDGPLLAPGNRNPLARELAAMHPGETRVSSVATEVVKGSRSAAAIITARKILLASANFDPQDAKADWAFKTLANGRIRITRLRPGEVKPGRRAWNFPEDIFTLIKDVEAAHGVTLAELRSRAIARPITQARECFVRKARAIGGDTPRYTFDYLAKILDKRSNTLRKMMMASRLERHVAGGGKEPQQEHDSDQRQHDDNDHADRWRQG